MARTKFDISRGEYATVADRITLFYRTYPKGRILTRIVSRDEIEVTVRATVFRDTDEKYAAASGLASERFGDGDINAVACVENTETSAIGRALANLGFTASSNRPSLEEMMKAQRAHSRLTVVREMSQLSTDEKQLYANGVTDVLRLVTTGERHGLRPMRAAAMREKLRRYFITPHDLSRIEHRLRRWINRQIESRMEPGQPA